MVRHAHAGAKDRWAGDDRLRPLDARGRSEARSLVETLAPLAPVRIVSSPMRRCVETVEPLARQLGLSVERCDALLPDAGAEAAEFVADLGAQRGPVVVCTHGETIDAMQAVFSQPGRRAEVAGFASGDPHEKGSVWVLRLKAGRLVGARYLPPEPAGRRTPAPRRDNGARGDGGRVAPQPDRGPAAGDEGHPVRPARPVRSSDGR